MKFKIGPCKTRGGKEAVIFELDGNYAHGKFKISDHRWEAHSWIIGFGFDGVWETHIYHDKRDLIPNAVPIVVEFESHIDYSSGKLAWISFRDIPYSHFEKLIDKKVHIKVTEIIE